MAELKSDEAPDASPQWLQEYQRPAEDAVLLSSPSSPSRGDDDEQGRYRLSEWSESDGDEPGVEAGGQLNEEMIENVGEGDDAVPDDESGKPEAEVKKMKSKMVSALPLVFPDKILRSKVLLECEGDALDLSGDIGAVGRVSVSAKNDVLLDLKGTVYRTNIVPSNSFFLVNIGASEAKVEALMNDFVQLIPDTHTSNVETMIEGTLEGITFDSDDEGVVAAPPPSTAEVTEQDKKNVRKGKATKESKAPKATKVAARKPVKRSGAKATTSRRAPKKSK